MGDCTTEDAHGSAHYMGGVTGDLVGSITGEGEGTYRADKQCTEGTVHVTFVLTDTGGNELFLSETSKVAATLATGPDGVLEAAVNVPQAADAVNGGTGKYRSASGQGSCSVHTTTQFKAGATTFTSLWQYDCVLDVRTPGKDGAS